MHIWRRWRRWSRIEVSWNIWTDRAWIIVEWRIRLLYGWITIHKYFKIKSLMNSDMEMGISRRRISMLLVKRSVKSFKS
jgi:hypothetical protein